MSLSVAHLTKRYGTVTAVDDVTFTVPRGSVFGLLGPNGAGKTTTFKCMLGLARPNAGTALFDGAPLTAKTFERLAYVPERSALYEWMTVREHLAMQRHDFTRFDARRAHELAELFALDPRKRVRSLSKGLRTALAVVLAFSIDAEVLVLDEPTSGLDPLNQHAVVKLIVEAAARGRTIVFSSHQIGQVERAANHIAVLQRGKIVLAGAVEELKTGLKVVEGTFTSDEFALDGISGDARISRIEQIGRLVRLTVNGGADELVAQRLAATGAQNVRVAGATLEDVFLNAVDPTPRTTEPVERA
jgi:ABC-2 type transport system ATP-binding protein